MSEFILHHYPMSPFAEKMRAMLGYAQVPWQSVITREMPPRPKLARLAGGYRKIPVAQIGADVFCDTHLIATEIAALGNKPDLVLENCSADVQAFVKTVDVDIFFACIMAGGSKRLRQKVWQSMSLLDIGRFMWDRINMGRTAAIKMPGPRESMPKVLAHLQQLEASIRADFLFGAQPCHGDFSAYHSLWFVRDLGERSFMNDYPKVIAWMDRMKAFGHGRCSEISADAALAQAAAAQPRAVPDDHLQDPLIGRQVSIAPADYGRDATDGVLVGSGPLRWIVARQDKELGTVHVHFPRQGFSLTPR